LLIIFQAPSKNGDEEHIIMPHGAAETTIDPAQASWRSLLFGAKARIVWTISIGVSIQAFGWFLVSTIMPSVVLQLGKPQMLSWGTTAFLALSIPGSASAGYLKARFGSRRLLIAATLLVILANLLGLTAANMEVFLLARAVQGLGEGLVLALCYILIGDALEPPEMAPVLGIQAVVWALATLIGPSLAGLLTDWVNWRCAFVPLLALATVFLILIATEKRPLTRMATTAPAAAALPLGRLAILGLAIIGVSFAGATRDALPAAALIFAAFALLAWCFHLDRTSAQRLFPRNLLSLRHPATLGVWIIGFMYAADSGPPIYMAYFVQVGHGSSVFMAGQFAAITALAWSIAAMFASRFAKSRGRHMLVIGPTCLTAGLTVLIFWPLLPLVAGGLALAVTGIGFGLSYAFLMEFTIAAASDDERDLTAGAIPTFESLCAAIGAALMGLLGNAAGFGGFGATDIPAAVAGTVFGAGAAGALLTVACAIRFWRLVGRQLR
jgi:MFS family permease